MTQNPAGKTDSRNIPFNFAVAADENNAQHKTYE